MKNSASCADLQLDHQLCFALYSTSLLLTKVYKPLLKELGLTYPQYLAMLVLWEADGINVGELSSRLLTDPGSLTPLLKRLESEGSIIRKRSREDERVVNLFLTQHGKDLQTRALQIPNCILQASGMQVNRLQTLQAELVALRAQLQNSV